MREYSTPLTAELPGKGNLTDPVVRNADEAPDAVVFARRTGQRVTSQWTDVTAAEFLGDVRRVAKGLIASGIEPGDRIGLVSRTRYEWSLLDYAIWFAGAISVPIYETSSDEQIEWILADSASRAVFAETPGHRVRIASVRTSLPELAHVWPIDAAEGETGAVEALSRSGAATSDDELERRRTTAGAADLATLIYTSGTTGRPKGCRLTHGNLMTEIGVAVPELHRLFDAGESRDAATLLFLPLAHVFARVIQLGCVQARVRLAHAADVTRLLEDLAEVRPTFLLAVPRVFEKVFNTASQRAVADGRGRIFDRAAVSAIAWSRTLDRGRPGVGARLRHAAHDRLVYARMREALGGRCEYAVSGGAPLGERLGHFYRGIGVTVLEGYGLTETTAAVCVNLPEAQRIGSVGRPLPGTAVRVAEDGELLVRGGQVFDGYWNNTAATDAVFDETGRWLRTGDIGEIDADGFVRITGRRKEILVTAGGKNVAPTVLEDRLRAHPLVDQCMVVGDGRPYVAALVTLDPDTAPQWARSHGKPTADLRSLSRDPDVLAEIQKGVDEANLAVSRAESIRVFTVVPGPWTEEGGQLTPSLKLKRTVVLGECHDDIERLYARRSR